MAALLWWCMAGGIGFAVLYYCVLLLLHGGRVDCKSKRRLDGKTAIVTGGSSGIGLATATDLAFRGSRVIIASRQVLKGQMVAQEIRALTGNQDVHYCHLDLADTNSIRDFASRIYNSESRLDILINNAAISRYHQPTTVDGYEAVFGVNFLGHFLLTYLLLDLMKCSGGGRIVNVSSLAHGLLTHPMDLSVYEKHMPYHLYPYLSGYESSKLALVMFAKELARRYSDFNVRANSCHPGLVLTTLWKSTERSVGKVMFALLKFILRPFFVSAEAAAQSVIHCAVSEEMDHVTGKYIKHCQVSRESRHALDTKTSAALWAVSLFMTGCPSRSTLQDLLQKRIDPDVQRRKLCNMEWWELKYLRRKDPDIEKQVVITRA